MKNKGLKIWLLAILVSFIMGFGVFLYLEHAEEERCEYMVWKARSELDFLLNDKIVGYLRFSEMTYEDRILTLRCIAKSLYQAGAENVSDTLLRKLFYSVAALHPDKWEKACDYLIEAKTNLSLTWASSSRPPIIISGEELKRKLIDNSLAQEGIEYFTIMKSEEIKDYALIHFKDDRYIHFDSVYVKPDMIELSLLYEDANARLGKSFLDTANISAHFIDPVGDMGSILDGMLAICTRTNRGIAITYTGKTTGLYNSIRWNADKIGELAKRYGGGMYFRDRKTNQVGTVVVKGDKERK